MAEVTQDYFDGSARKAETLLGWSRQAIATGLKELETPNHLWTINPYIQR